MTDASRDLMDRVLDARSRGAELNIVGHGSKQFLGREARGETVSLAAHRGIVSYQPRELVVTARAGTPMNEIQQTLAADNMTLAFEPPLFEGRASIGGTLACHLSGPARPWRGSVRDMVLGVRLINGRGEQLKFGGQVIKNVAGYDVSRLQAGAMGTLGIITEISLKVMPRPESELTLVEEMAAGEALVRMNRLAGKPKPLSAACWCAGRLFLRFSGTHSAVDAAVKAMAGTLMEEADVFWAALRDQQLPFFRSAAMLQRFSVKSSAAHVLPGEDWLLDWGGAQRWLAFAQDRPFPQAELERLAESMGGQVMRYRGGERQAEVFHTPPPAMRALQRRVKLALDPDGLFNPGRLYSWM